MNKIKFFNNRTDLEIKQILNQIKHRYKKIKKDEFFMFRGEKINGLIILINGKLGAFMPKPNGEIHKIETLKSGDIIASAFIFGKNNTLPVDLVSETDCELLEISRDNLLKLFEKNTDILTNFLNEISTKTQFLSNKVWKSVNNRTIREKLIDFILENKKEETFTLTLSIKELAEQLNTTRPSLSRVIKSMLENKELEKIDKKRFKILANF